MTTRKPPTPPTPRHIKPLAHRKTNGARPLTAALMSRCKSIRDESEGRIDNTSIASSLGCTKSEVAEWLGAYRSAPNSETTLGFILYFIAHDKNLIKNLLA
jgi:hypothetical protein